MARVPRNPKGYRDTPGLMHPIDLLIVGSAIGGWSLLR
jgi:hypothetical protein